MTSRAFCGESRTWRASAWASIEGACVCTLAMAYAFGAGAAAAGAAAPPTGAAAAAALSSAALTAWPLKVRVGENSPNLCPIICSVTYTGMNFLPLCTAMVWPIISGTIVERRDQVFTTFFSFRAFSASTFSRRWPSTNGPFLSERPIANLCLHAAQASPLRAPNLLEASHRPGHAMRLRAERADKACALRVRLPLDDDGPSWLAQPVENRLGRLDARFDGCVQDLRGWLGGGLFAPVLPRSASPPGCCPCCSCRSHWSTLDGRLCHHRPPSPSVRRAYPFRRWTIFLSVRLLCRVFAPSVGKPHGVCG